MSRKTSSPLRALALAIGISGCASAPPGSPPRIDSFGDFKPASDWRDYYLACPQNYCFAKANEVTPLERVPAAHMLKLVRTALDAMPGAHFLEATKEGLRLVYRIDGGMFSRAGTVTVEIVDVEDGISGLVLYAEADGGGHDYNGNQHRVRDSLVAIYAEITRDLAAAG